MTIFVFLHIPLKVSVFGKTLQTHLDSGYVNIKKIINFFNILKYVLCIEEAYARESRIESPHNI
jgi:hypothetical protein